MRVTLLALSTQLAACSFLTPPSSWHPSPQLGVHSECAPYFLPVVDSAIGGTGIYTGIYLLEQVRNRPPTFGTPIVQAIATLAIAASLPWVAGAAYGYTRSHVCEAELAELRATASTPRETPDAMRLKQLAAKHEAQQRAYVLMKTAAAAAHAGDCATVTRIDVGVEEVDSEFHSIVFVRDVAIARCLADASP